MACITNHRTRILKKIPMARAVYEMFCTYIESIPSATFFLRSLRKTCFVLSILTDSHLFLNKKKETATIEMLTNTASDLG